MIYRGMSVGRHAYTSFLFSHIVAQAAVCTKDVAAVRQTAEMYKDWAQSNKDMDSYVFFDIDGDSFPECIAINGSWYHVLTCCIGKTTGKYFSVINDGVPFYNPGKNVFCIYDEDTTINFTEHAFYAINDKGLVEIGHSRRWGSTYSTATQNDTTKAIYDDNNSSFGQLVEISLEYEDTYQSIHEACNAYLAQ